MPAFFFVHIVSSLVDNKNLVRAGDTEHMKDTF